MINLSFWRLMKENLLREFNSRRIRALNSIIYITYRCTSRCSTCNIWKWAEGRRKEFKNSELDPKDWSQVIDMLYANGIRSVELFGGDALLRKDIVYSMINHCSELGIETFFPTNSNLLDQETADKLVLEDLGTIYFSVDGIDELHNRIRGIGDSYHHVKDAINYIDNARSKYQKNRPKIGSITTVSTMNADNIEDLLVELQKFPLDFLYLQALGEICQEDIEPSIIEGIKANPPFVSTLGQSNLLSREQAHHLSKTLKGLRKKKKEFHFYLGLSHIEPFNNETFTKGIFPEFPCHVCKTVVTLTPFGDVVPCPMFTDFILGNILKEGSLHRIWGNEKHRHFIEKQRNKEFPVCRKCSMRHFYPGLGESLRQILFPYLSISSDGDK